MRVLPDLDDTACYRAMCSHDARFDGRFFTAVTSTGIYCRPVCRVRAPRQANCRFFALAAQAEQAGFRPCLRCRPELAPQQRHWSNEDASSILLQQATRLLDNPQDWSSNADPGAQPGATVARLASRLGISDRHLRRIFAIGLGVSPLQYLLTRKLLCAKQLLTDSEWPITEVAHASGFASVRRFNAAFLAQYRINPSHFRRAPAALRGKAVPGHSVTLCWRPPHDMAALLGFLADRQMDGVEHFQGGASLGWARTLRLQHMGREHTGWLRGWCEPEANRLRLQISPGLRLVWPLVIGRVRQWLDLDADPLAINAVLHPHFPSADGLRVPGCMDGFELAVRAVLGQQITVQAARVLATRLVAQWGTPIDTDLPALHRLFPTAQALACADANALGEMGIVRQRQAAIQALARAVCESQIELNPMAHVPRTLDALLALPGVGPWTAHYIAMRALRWPNAWPSGDVALIKGLQLNPQAGSSARKRADAVASVWQPWRSYAAVRTWAGAYQLGDDS